MCATACSTTLTRTHHNRGGQGDFALLLNFSWENLAAFRIFACLGSSRCSLISIPNRFYTHQESFTTVHTASVTIFLNSGPTPAIVVVGSSARVTQSDVCDVTFPKTDCARRSPARLSRAHFFRGGLFCSIRTALATMTTTTTRTFRNFLQNLSCPFSSFFSSLRPISQ